MYVKLDHLLTESTSKMFTLEMTTNIFFLSDNRAKTLSVAVFSCDFVQKIFEKGPALCCNDHGGSQFDTTNSCQYEMN